MAVIGIDSHEDVLAGCLIDEAGHVVEYRSIANTDAGHAELVGWARAAGAGRVAIEGSGNDGRSAAVALLAAGIEVVEVPPQMTARARRRQRSNTKTGRVGALLVARVGARDDDVAPARRDGHLDELRCLVGYRRELVKSRTGHVDRLHGDVEEIRCGYHRTISAITSDEALTRVMRLLCGDTGARANVAGGRVTHIRELNRQIADLTSQIGDLVADTATTLTDIHAVGALTAADTLAEVGDPARFATKAKLAIANGAAPPGAGSGRIVGHRLNRGANRQLNRAIHTAAITPIARNHSERRRLYEQHLNRAKTKREAVRALKRRISDRIWTHLQHHPTTPHHAPNLT